MNANGILTLPRGSVVEPAAAVDGSQDEAAVDLKANILLVDDRPDKLLAFEAILGSLGQRLILARSGKEALRHLLKEDFAVILMDVSMPTMDGFETAALIRKRPKTEHTPIIFVTSIGNTENHMARGYSLGAVDYLLTPIVPEVLRAKVSVFVELHRQTALIKRQAEELRQDMEARLRAEQEICKLNSQLEQRVSALTEINQELEAFNYSISHDLRAPLRSMSSFAQALLDEEKERMTEQGLDFARRIARSAKYMDNLLHDLLTYSRLARTEITAAEVSLDETINEVLTVFEKEIGDRCYHTEVTRPLGTVQAHAATLKQVLSNLVGNSIKFVAPERPLHLRIYTAKHGNLVRLWIQDNGIGIAAEHHDKIFGLFQRLHDSQKYPGTGIGLALVRKGAERMGGRTGVESELGQGSRFWIELPAEPQAANAP